MATPRISPLTKSEIRRGLRISSWEGAFGNVYTVLVGNVFLTGFALAWGAGDLALGLLGAIPFLGVLGQPLGAYLVDRHPKQRREVVLLLGLVSRSCWWAIAALPFLLHSSRGGGMIWIALLLLFYQVIYNASGPGWVAWMAALIPQRVQGRYLGVRLRAGEAAGMLTALAAGFAVDAFRAAHWERPGFAVLQMLAAGTGIVCFLLLRRQPDPGYSAPAPEAAPAYLFRPLKDPPFRALVFFNVAWCFGLNVATPFLNAHLLNNMRWDFKRLAALGVLASVAAVVMNPLWGRMADRFGHKIVLRVSCYGMLAVPIFYALCPWSLRWPIYLANVVSGVALSGFTLAMFGLVLKWLPKEAGAMGAALFAALAGPATAVSGALSGWLAEWLARSGWSMGAFTPAPYQVLFLLSVALRLPTLFLLEGLCESETEPKRFEDLLTKPRGVGRGSDLSAKGATTR